MSKLQPKLAFDRRQLILAAILVIALYVLLPQLSGFRNSWHLLRGANISWVLIAVILTLFTFACAALNYCLLAVHKLRYYEVVLVEFAATAINRLLPAGIGALGANYAFLRHRQHSSAQAGTIIAVNNLLGIIGHVIVVILALLLSNSYSRHIAFSTIHWRSSILWLVLGIVIAALILAGGFASERIKRVLLKIRQQLSALFNRPWHLSGALLSSMTLTVCNVLCLYSCMYAVGVYLPFFVVLVIFSFGLGAGTITPTPGGLGGFEAGLAAGFVAYHQSSAQGLAIALLFRLISYWLVLILGLFAFIFSQRRHLMSIPTRATS